MIFQTRSRNNVYDRCDYAGRRHGLFSAWCGDVHDAPWRGIGARISKTKYIVLTAAAGFAMGRSAAAGVGIFLAAIIYAGKTAEF